MENTNTQTIARPTDFNAAANYNRDHELAQQRLDILLAVNAETVRKNSNLLPEKEQAEAAAMKHPLSDRKVFAYFGILLGIFPPAAIFTRFFMNNGNLRFEDLWVFGVVAVVNLITALVGYFSGKAVGKVVGELERLSWSKMLLALPFIGILWGALAGGAGGTVIFIFGAVFGAIFGGAVGGFALSVFSIFHRLLKKGDKIDRRHFLPLAFGITLIVSAFILGL